MAKKLRFAVLGCGFWAQYQIPAWLELEDVELVALYNRTLSDAQAMGDTYHVPSCYDNAENLFQNEKLDFADIITDVDTHAPFVEMAARYGVPVICQKPMSSKYHSAERMMEACRNAGIPLYIHENFRWQAPIRMVKKLLNIGKIGTPFKARVSYCSAFPVFDNQPFLADLEEFILTDMGSHILDVSRFLFGEAESLYCQTASINRSIKGEDVANVFMKMESGLHCYVELSYASILQRESFPQTLLQIEGNLGSITLTNDFHIMVTTRAGSYPVDAQPVLYNWLDPAYAVVHSSIVDCNRNILDALRGEAPAETTGEDNFKTVKLVWAAYHSAKVNQVVCLDTFKLLP